MTLFSLYKLIMTPKNYCFAEMMTKLNNEARGQNLFLNMALEEKSLNTPGLNFINVLHTAFTCTDPKSVRRY